MSESSWSTTDERFFRLVKGLFPAEFLYGATVLLADYDDDARPASRNAGALPTVERTAPTATPGGVSRTPLGG